MTWATVSSWSCFCWLYRASPSLAAKNMIYLISVLTIWWCPCVVFSCVAGRGVCYDQCVLLAKLQKQETSRKTAALLTLPKPLTMWITINCGKFLERWEYQTTWLAPWENRMQLEATVRSEYWITDWFQIRKGVHQGCIYSPCLLNLYAEYIMRNAELDEAEAEITSSEKYQ